MANITRELLTIDSGRYGSDIRLAIHDALQKMADEINEEDENGEETS